MMRRMKKMMKMYWKKMMKKFSLQFIIFYFLCLFLVNAQIVSEQAVQIKIQGVPSSEQQRINGIYPLTEEGYIRMWKIGDIKAEGLAFNELAERIEEAYREAQIYVQPNIQVLANSEAKLKTYLVTVGGRVGRPGPVSYYKGIKLYEAISAAGGVDVFGASHRIEVYRKKNDEAVIYNLNENSDKHAVLLPGDIIEVPEKNWLGR